MNGLLTALILVAWGSQAVVPWRLRRAGETTATPAMPAPPATPRQLWGHAALPLLLAGALAALLYVHERPDAAIAGGLSPLFSSLPGKILVLLLAALLAVELAPIRVNIVTPGYVDTELWANVPAAARAQMFREAAAKLPVGHVAGPAEIAEHYVSFMRGRYVTGQALIVDGGGVLV